MSPALEPNKLQLAYPSLHAPPTPPYPEQGVSSVARFGRSGAGSSLTAGWPLWPALFPALAWFPEAVCRARFPEAACPVRFPEMICDTLCCLWGPSCRRCLARRCRKQRRGSGTWWPWVSREACLLLLEDCIAPCRRGSFAAFGGGSLCRCCWAFVSELLTGCSSGGVLLLLAGLSNSELKRGCVWCTPPKCAVRCALPTAVIISSCC